ncbi:MAG TPA: TlpA disulfide reductase family protein [Verrucomicrobiae bacterium]|nr:TlpA disulfide reductase family protein [Verrucomicrobiae bacterium]
MTTKFPNSYSFGPLLVVFLMLSQWIAAADDSTLTKVGDKSPVVSVRTIDGQDVDFQGRVVVLNFFATWCGPCMSEMPHLEKDLWQPLKDKGVILISVGREHSVAEVEKFKNQKGYSFLFAADPKREIFSKFATQSIPRCVVIGRDGRIKFQSIGFEEGGVTSLVKAVQSELEK